jgi:hypothetical protein
MPPPFAWSALNHTPGLDVTSGGGPELRHYCSADSTGFYGQYTLIDRRDPRLEDSRVGTLIIHHPDADMGSWTSDDERQAFRYLSLHSSVLTLWDSVRVGMSEAALLDFIAPYEHADKLGYYLVELQPYTAEFHLSDGALTHLHLWLNCP